MESSVLSNCELRSNVEGITESEIYHRLSNVYGTLYPQPKS